MEPLVIVIMILTIANSVAIFLLTAKNINIMATLQELQEMIDATNVALDNVQAEMTAQKQEIDDLKEQIGGMGLTAEQEAIIAAGLSAIRSRAEAISTVDENPPVEDPETPEEA